MSLREELKWMDATGQAALIRDGQLTATEAVEAAIERSEDINPALNAVVTPMYGRAVEEAAGLLPDGPFRGVPFLLKDLVASYAGVRMTFASRFLQMYVPDHDSELVARLRRAGLIVMGKANASEFGLMPSSEPALFGACHNPWDLSLSTGGSSGGSAAAVAGGIVPMAHANDAGGSIRIPASCCGLFGLRPTRARNSLGPDTGDIMNGLVVEHALTRTVRDSAALLDATCGPAIGDPYYPPPPERPYAEEVGADPGRLRIAFTDRSPTEGYVHPDCIEAVRSAAGLCEELGHVVEELELDVSADAVTQSFTSIYAAGAAWTIDVAALLAGKEPRPDDFETLTWALAELGRKVEAPDYLMAVATLQGVSRIIAGIFAPYDAVLSPTITVPPYPLGRFDSPPDNPLLGLVNAANIVPFTAICNFTGLPAMSVPLHFNDVGLPIGVQFAGRYGDEATLFRLAAQLEEARPWAERRPPDRGRA